MSPADLTPSPNCLSSPPTCHALGRLYLARSPASAGPPLAERARELRDNLNFRITLNLCQEVISFYDEPCRMFVTATAELLGNHAHVNRAFVT